jgi:hypothetical protein
MVYNIEELAKRLANGESADTIAAEMADMLNAANAKVEEDNRLAMERVAREKAERLAADKRADIREILTDLTQYLGFYYPDMCATAMQGIPEDEHDDLMDLVVDTVVETLDKTAEQMANPRKNILGLDPMTMMLVSDLFNKTETAAKKTPVYEKPKIKSDDDILNDFLNKICH